MSRLVVPILAVFVLIAHGTARSEPAATPYVPQYRTTARWHGDMSGQHHSYARREPGGLGLSFSQANSVQTTRARVVLREEVDDATGDERTVVESLSWSSSIDDLYYLNKDGSRVAAGPGGSGSGSYSEEQLLGNRQPPRPEEIQALLQMVQEGRVQVEEAEREKAEGEKAGKDARRVRLASELEDAKRALRKHEAQLYEAQNRRAHRATARVEYGEDAKSGKRTVSVDFRMNDDKLREFPIKVIKLRLIGFGTLTGAETTEIVKASLPRVRGISFRGKTEMANPDEAVTIRVADKRQSGSPGLAGGSEWSVASTFTRVPVKQQFLVRGEVLHRIRVPLSEIDLNVVRASDSTGSLKGAIPVAGQVKIEAWLTDAKAAIRSSRPPDVVGSTRDDSSFEVALPSAPGKRLRLRFVYHNAEAQVTEYNTMEIPTDQILDVAASNPSGPAPLPDVVRTTAAFFRFGNSPREYPIGTETRGAVVRRDGGQTVLQFSRFNAILVNSFIVRTPYLNQNLQGFSVAGVKVPAARLLAARPNFVSEATVRSRLGVPAAGNSPEQVETEIKIRGTVVCFPTTVTMALAGLGLVDVKDKIARADQIRELAHGVYHFHAQRSRAPRRHPEPPWVFPFPDDPAPFNRAGDEAFQSLLRRMGRLGDITELARDWSKLSQTHRAYFNWPFVGEGTNDLAKQWLISLDKGRYPLWVETSTGAEFLELEKMWFRPWQVPTIVRDYLRAKYGTEKVKVTYWGNPPENNPFDQAQKVVNVLGGGGTGVISIDHCGEDCMADLKENRSPTPGGHILALVGVVIDNFGDIVQVIVHDPYGDQTRNPGVEGYYHPADMDDRSKYDKDSKEAWGAYASYAPEINSFRGRLYGKYWLTFEDPSPDVKKVRDRLLPSELSSGSIPTPSP